MTNRTLIRASMAACLIVAVSAVGSGCSGSTEDRLRSENADLMARLEAAEAARDAAREAEEAAVAVRLKAEEASEAAAMAEARAAAERDAAVEAAEAATAAAEAARERAEEAAAARAAAEAAEWEAAAERDAAVAEAEAALERAEAAVAALAAAQAAEGEASATRDAAIAEAEAAEERAGAAEAALAVAEAARDEAVERVVAAEEALAELLDLIGNGNGGGSIAWGPRLDMSNLSAVLGAEDDFGPDVTGGVRAAARAAPAGAVNGVSQVSPAARPVGGMRVQVVHDDGNLVYELTDDTVMVVRVPSPLPRQDFDLALFTDLIPGIEPDLSSYPHDVLGMWAWNGAVGAFWGRSPSIPGVRPTGISPSGRATYEGDAVGLHASATGATKFLADVGMVADFDRHTVGGTVDGFRSLAGKPLGALTITLGETGFSSRADMFSGATSSGSVAGSGQWGARWSDGDGWTMGGTFGFAADDASVAVLGAFNACSCARIGGVNPDDPVSTAR